MRINHVAVMGGTHGNEPTGPYLLNILEQRGIPASLTTFALHPVLANPLACSRNVRFIDQDLNRSFLAADLADDSLQQHEARRAKEINQLLGPKGDAKTDLILDIHTSTANMGTTVILQSSSPFQMQLAAHVQSALPGVSIYAISAEAYTGGSDQPFLPSIAETGIGLEFGPIPNGILRHDLVNRSYAATLACLEYIELANQGRAPMPRQPVAYFEHVKTVSFPLDTNGHIDAVIHESLQDRDYTPLIPGDPIFVHRDGRVIHYAGDEVLYPVFINEAAYYPQKAAFSLTRKNTISL